MNPFEGRNDILELRMKYREKYGKCPPGINYDQFNSLDEYKEYLIKHYKEDENADDVKN